MLLTLGVLAAGSVIASEAPRIAAWPSALVAMAYAIRLARHELRRPARSLVVPATDASATLDGVPMADLQAQWRGPLLFLEWRDARGCRQRMQGWPDTVPGRVRRELRLAIIARATALSARSMAP